MNLARALALPTLVVSSLIPGLSARAEFTIEKTAGDGVIVKVDGKPFAEYVVDQANKPYLAPVFGPTGKQMTRNYPMTTVEGEQHDHPHHRGICFGNENVAGFDTWAEKATYAGSTKKKASDERGLAKIGSIKHRKYLELTADADHAVIAVADDLLAPDGHKALDEEHRITFHATADTRTIDYDIDYIASEGPVVFADAKDAGFSIRLPTSMAVESKLGGHIINSEGITDGDAWSKRASWCEYDGPVDGEKLGVAMLNHPSSFRYPTPWHVRTYGLFTANAFGFHSLDKTRPVSDFELKQGEHLKLRHRLIFHKGDEKDAHIAEAFAEYAKETR